MIRLAIATVGAAIVAAAGASYAGAQLPAVAEGPGGNSYVFTDAQDPDVSDSGGGIFFDDNAGNVMTTTSPRCFVPYGTSWMVACTYGPGLVTIVPAFGENEVDASGSPVAAFVDAGMGRDTVLGSPYADELHGGADGDELHGMSGGDHLDGGTGNDDLYAGDGDDFLDGDDYAAGAGSSPGPGSDLIDGGPGRDDALYRWRTKSVHVSLDGNRNDGEDREFDQVTNVEDLEGGYGPDVLEGDGGPNVIAGRAGNDVIRGGGGDDYLDGNWGEDTIVGGPGKDLFLGRDDADLIDSRDGAAEQVGCGTGVDRVIADRDDLFPAGDCELVDSEQRQTVRFLEEPRQITEGDSGIRPATFELALPAPSSAARSVRWTLQEGTATTPADFQLSGGTVAIPPWAMRASFTVGVAGDILDEPDETFAVEVRLFDAASSLLDQARQDVAIVDDDPEPSLSVDDPSIDEAGKAGPMTFTISLSESSAKTVTVEYATQSGTAREEMKNRDYEPVRDVLTFLPGETTKEVEVAVEDDGLPEADETFELVLTSPTNADFRKDVGTGTILDDDFPFASIADASVSESPSGQSTAVFSVVLSQPSGRPISIDYATADATALAGSDYRALPRSTVSFAPGGVAMPVQVIVDDDALDENDETFTVMLVGTSGARIADATGVGTIVDDDPAPMLSTSSPVVTEGTSGVTTAQFTISLSPTSGRAVRADYATLDGTATAPADYAATTGTVTLNPGETSKTVTVGVSGDTTVEPHEDFYLIVSAAFATVTTHGRATILNDD